MAEGAAGGGVPRLRICVADQGDGISAENLTRIFDHGFTTRSDGPGLGATFTLELPVKTEGVAS